MGSSIINGPAIASVLRRAAALVLVLAAPAALAQDAARPAPEGASGRTTKPAVVAAHEMVVAAHPLAAQAGADILAHGGSAADAAIAVQLMLGLVEPQSSGIGGGAFVLAWDGATRRLTSFDGRETAPRRATPALFLQPDGKPSGFYDAVVGGRAVGVPGVPRLLADLHARAGRLPWARLFEPAIARAEQGFPMSPRLATLIARDAFLADDAAARALFYLPDGSPKPAGSVIVNPAYAETLRIVARDGAGAFYTGAIAADLVAAVARAPHPGTLDADDLAHYRVIEREPVCGAYRAVRVCGMGPPSSGGVTVLQILGLLERFDLRASGPGTLASAHLIAEASRLAFADRDQHLADPAFAPQPIAALLDPAYLRGRAALIAPDRSLGRASPGALPQKAGALPCCAPDASPELPSTSHFSIVDRDGNAIAMTTTIEDQFGARRMVRGFLLNNQLTDFSFLPERDGKPVANRVEGGKRPRSSVAPTIVLGEDGNPLAIVGSPGGSRIIGYVAQTLIALLDWDLDPQAAVSLPHVVNRNGPTDLEADTRAQALTAGLEALGHTVHAAALTSGLHVILRRDGTWIGGADPRRDGVAIGR